MPEYIKSFRYPFAIDKGLGVVQEENNFEQHVKQLIIQLLLTTPGERVNRPDFGCGLKAMVFEGNSIITANLLQVTIRQSLDQWLGSVITINDVTTEAKEEKLLVTVEYQLIALRKNQILNIEVV